MHDVNVVTHINK